MNILVLNLLVITLLPVLNLCGGGKISLQKSLSKQFVSGRSADTFFLYLFNKLRAYACEAIVSYAQYACPFVWKNNYKYIFINN